MIATAQRFRQLESPINRRPDVGPVAARKHSCTCNALPQGEFCDRSPLIVLELRKCPFTPLIAFAQQRKRKEQRFRARGQFDGELELSRFREAPVQRRPQVSNEVRHGLLPPLAAPRGPGVSDDIGDVKRVSARSRSIVTTLFQFVGCVGARRFEQSVAYLPEPIGGPEQ